MEHVVSSIDIISEFFTQQTPPAQQRIWHDPNMPIVYSGFGSQVIMAVFSGTLSMANAGRLGPVLEKLLTGNSGQIILSLVGVTKLSHTAVGILVNFAASALGRGKELLEQWKAGRIPAAIEREREAQEQAGRKRRRRRGRRGRPRDDGQPTAPPNMD